MKMIDLVAEAAAKLRVWRDEQFAMGQINCYLIDRAAGIVKALATVEA